MPLTANSPLQGSSKPQAEVTQLACAPAMHSAWRVILLLLCFGVGLFGTGTIINSVLPFPALEIVQPKVNWLAHHGDQYDTLFIGSSRTFGHIIPSLFDRLMAEGGKPTHSFNLGLNGMRSPEDSFLLETVLSKRRAPLKLVVVESNRIWVPGSDGDSRKTDRLVYWHDFKRLAALTHSTFVTKYRPYWYQRWKVSPKKLGELEYNFELFCSRTLNLGRGQEMIISFFEKSDSPWPKRMSQDGFELHGQPDKIDQDEWDILHAQVQRLLKNGNEVNYADPQSQYELDYKRHLIQAHGGRMVVFIPPLAGGREFFPDPQAKPPFPTFNFADPARYPVLFERDHRADSGHLNISGAEIFTRMLVEKILASD